MATQATTFEQRVITFCKAALVAVENGTALPTVAADDETALWQLLAALRARRAKPDEQRQLLKAILSDLQKARAAVRAAEIAKAAERVVTVEKSGAFQKGGIEDARTAAVGKPDYGWTFCESWACGPAGLAFGPALDAASTEVAVWVSRQDGVELIHVGRKAKRAWSKPTEALGEGVTLSVSDALPVFRQLAGELGAVAKSRGYEVEPPIPRVPSQKSSKLVNGRQRRSDER